ncbi:MAG: GTP-binding protein [Candidatus Asgardarchaeia archaeon]
MPNDIYKVVLMGDAGVGKTSIRRNFAGKVFRESYIMTIGVEIALKTFEVKSKNLSYGNVTFLIWDLGGQLKFTRVRENYYLGSSGGILVYDITNRTSFENLKNWLDELKKTRGVIPVILVGNKIDLRSQVSDTIPTEQGMKAAKELSDFYGYDIKFIETSAKTGENIEQAFNLLALEILGK